LSKKHGAYRSRTDIISQILEIANSGGAAKTKIFYNVLVNYEKLREYLTILIESDLLIYDHEMHTFRTTDKGRMFLQAYNQIDQMLKEQQI
jgi:predicted transcriptional regulator